MSRIIVIGDIMLDSYIIGNVNRISPEAPVPIVNVFDTTFNLGGAANVALNASKLGAKVMLIGYLGNDSAADTIRTLIEANSIELLTVITKGQTILKTRVTASKQQIARIDYESAKEVYEEGKTALLEIIKKNIRIGDIVVFSDYAKGVFADNLTEDVIVFANQSGVKVLVDPKGHNWKKYTNAYIVTPNLKELSDVVGQNVDNLGNVIEVFGQKIRSQYQIENLVVTRSEKGMTLINKHNVLHLNAEVHDVYDVSGAGDTVIATIAFLLLRNCTLEKALYISNKAAGIVVTKFGTVPITYSEIQKYL
jgi:D-beta-D-heptose 7-phosphate kinase/D-beta-D-heptose 1-phosphate adenosyltransferase